MKQAEAKERQRQAGRLYGENHPKQELQMNPTEALEKSKPVPQVRKQVADALGISEYKMQSIIAVSKTAPEKVEQIKRGEIIEGRVSIIGNPAFIVR
jgi:hypothetical protein